MTGRELFEWLDESGDADVPLLLSYEDGTTMDLTLNDMAITADGICIEVAGE